MIVDTLPNPLDKSKCTVYYPSVVSYVGQESWVKKEKIMDFFGYVFDGLVIFLGFCVLFLARKKWVTRKMGFFSVTTSLLMILGTILSLCVPGARIVMYLSTCASLLVMLFFVYKGVYVR